MYIVYSIVCRIDKRELYELLLIVKIIIKIINTICEV